jgi:tetratricopeptide (TPR) repeat protein
VTDPRIQAIHDALDVGRLDRAIQAADLAVAAAAAEPHTELYLQAHRLAGLTRFHVGDFAGAIPFLRTAAEMLDDRPSWFALCMAHLQAGQVPEGEAAFARALSCPAVGVAEDMSDAHMRFDYLTNLVDAHAHDAALAQLEALRAAYRGLSSTEPAALMARRIPLLVHTLDNAVFLFDRLPHFDRAAWLRAFAAELDEGGRDLVLSYLQPRRR